MTLLITGTAINLGINLLLLYTVRRLYRQAKNLGWQPAMVKAGQVKIRSHRRRMTSPCLYPVQITYNGSRQSVLATKEEYERLRQAGNAMVYVREFPNRFLNPDFEKYEFSLREVDWNRRDKSRCLKGFLTVFLALELILCLVAAAV